MKFLMVMLAFVGSIANAEVRSFSCTGKTDPDLDTVTVSGSFEVIQQGGRSVYKRVGNLEIMGTDGGGQQLFSRGGASSAGTYRFFERVSYKSNGQFFFVEAFSNNGGKLDLIIPETLGSPVRAKHLEIDLPATGPKPAYWHEFKRARCTID